MATAQRTEQSGSTYLHKWTLTTADNNGDGISLAGAPDRCFQAFGNFGSGTLSWQGSLDGGTTWFGLHDPTYVTLGLTADGGGVILENALMIRPSLSGSTAASVDVYLFSRSSR